MNKKTNKSNITSLSINTCIDRIYKYLVQQLHNNNNINHTHTYTNNIQSDNNTYK
jgi:hypothetical protein